MSQPHIEPKFLVAATRYSNNEGGSMALHLLCHILNEMGSEAYVLPMPEGEIVSYPNSKTIENVRDRQNSIWQTFSVSEDLNTPIFSGNTLDEDLVVIYPEVVHGNPFRVKNVARWLLYHTGFHRKEVCLSRGEVQFLWSKEYIAAEIEGFVELSNVILRVESSPNDPHTALSNELTLGHTELHRNRTNVAYCVRKGNQLEHPLIDERAINIDGRPREEVINILRTSKYFISFDPATFYSCIAAALGCFSVVVTDTDVEQQGVTTRPWLTFERKGFEPPNYEDAWRERRKLLDHFESFDVDARKSVSEFIEFWRDRLNKKS